MLKAYIPAYLAQLFPHAANLYEKITKKEIPYRNNAVIFARFPERKSLIEGAEMDFTLGHLKQKQLEQKAAS